MKLLGSPPRRQGKANWHCVRRPALRITPAHAGKRTRSWRAYGCPWDHPRMGGEKRLMLLVFRAVTGSPPHGRGKVRTPIISHFRGGITPAWAGKSRSRSRRCSGGRDHPRVGGEKHPGHRCAGGLNGITPAWAGKRMQVSPKPTLPQDHPRVDGEKILEPSMGVGNFGSPPRGRGKAVKFRCTCGLQRITPALAGKSCRP